MSQRHRPQMVKPHTRLIAIDIDDVTANTHEAAIIWAEQTTGITLDRQYYYTDDPYWHYYDTIWERHGIVDLDFNIFLDLMEHSQDNIYTFSDATRVIRQLDSRYGVVFITSRDPKYHDATRQWIDKNIDPSIPLYMARNQLENQSAQSKGEICRDLGLKYLIDDSLEHCEDAKQFGVEPILFGDYGWNQKAPADLTRCKDWVSVEEYFDKHTPIV